MLNFGVTAEKQAQLQKRMEDCKLTEADLQERFVSSAGPGGQKVNRTATCVYLKHLPTGLAVKMQKTRSQAMNRFYARRQMCKLLEGRTLTDKSPEALRQEKIRKQKSRRKRRSKQLRPSSDSALRQGRES